MDGANQAEASQAEPIPSHVVAVVDDDPFVLRALGRALTVYGHRTLLFDNPWTALSGLPAAQVDVIVFDRQMPGCSGPSLARRLRDGWNGGGPPFILISGDLYGLTIDEEALFDHVLPKPFHPDDLDRAIRNTRHRTGTRLRARRPDDDSEPRLRG